MRMALHVVVDGALLNIPQDVAYKLIEDMAKNNHSWGKSPENNFSGPLKGWPL